MKHLKEHWIEWIVYISMVLGGIYTCVFYPDLFMFLYTAGK